MTPIKLTATETEEVARLADDFARRLAEELNAEDDVKAERNMGRLMRAARSILAEVTLVFGIMVLYCVALFALSGCNQSPAAERYEAMVADLTEVPDLTEKSGTDATEVRAREPERDPRFAEFPSTCILKCEASWCGPCHSERITEWLEASKWDVRAINCDANGDYCFDAECAKYDLDAVPTWIVLRGGREVARYTGTDINAFLPILKAACQ